MTSFYKHLGRKSAKRTNGFPSKLESAVFDILTLRERAGEITDIKRQQVVELQGGGRDTRITWRLDFSYTDVTNGKTVYVEAKGFEEQIYKRNLKMWRFNPPAKLEIYKGSYKNVKLVEVIEAKD